MDPLIQSLITVFCSILASSGLWAFASKIADKKDVRTQMLVGLAHDRILSLGMQYLERGDWITRDEYENLHDYLYIPYEKMGGNGSAHRVMQEVDNKLKIVNHPPILGEEDNNEDQ